MGKLLSGICWLICAAYLTTTVIRIAYPYPLWNLECDIFQHVQRLRTGLPLYPEWGDSFTPLLYSPLYYILGMPFTYLINGLPGLRLLSLLSIALTALAVVKFGKISKLPSIFILLILAFLSMISPLLSGVWETVRTDGFMLMLVLWGGYFLIKPGMKTTDAIIAGILFTSSFYVKQTAAPFILAGLLYSLIYTREYFVRFLISFVSSMLILFILFRIVFGPGFVFFVFEVPMHQDFNISGFLPDILEVWIKQFSLIILLAIGCVIANRKSMGCNPATLLTFLLPAAFLVYILPRGKYGGFSLNIFPFAVICCVMAGWTIWYLSKLFTPDGTKPGIVTGKHAVYITMLAVLPFVQMIHNPFSLLPNRDNRAMNIALVEEFKSIDGGVYLPVRGYYAFLAGHDSHASAFAIADVINAGFAEGYPKGLKQKFLDGDLKYLLLASRDKFDPAEPPPDLSEFRFELRMLVNPLNYNPNPAVPEPPIILYELFEQ